MFDLQTQLFEGPDVRLGPIDYEKDPEIESRWTHDSDFMRMYEITPVRPKSIARIKKEYEKLEKDMEELHRMYYFAIRMKNDNRLIGKASVIEIDRTHGFCYIRFGIGQPEDRRKGYATQAVRMLLRFVFAELNLFRIGATVPEYNEPAAALLLKLGFVEEVRRRKALERDGRRWDLVHYGLLVDEWTDQATA